MAQKDGSTRTKLPKVTIISRPLRLASLTEQKSKISITASTANAPIAAMPSCSKAKAKAVTKLSPFQSLYDEIVYVKVGSEKTNFGVHKGLLCHQSKYWQAAFNGSFAEAESGVIELPEEVALFEMVNAWLYTSKFTAVKAGEDIACNAHHLVELYIFGDKYDMPNLCNAVIDRIIALYQDEWKILALFSRIWDNTTDGSPLRELTLAMHIHAPWRLKQLVHKETGELIACPEFTAELVKRLVDAWPTPETTNLRIPPVIQNPCQLHRHPDGQQNCS